jgi:hypothetical protein
MTLHPIRVLDHVLDEYRDYLRTEFRPKAPELRASLERELDASVFLAQKPFYQAHRPLRRGQPWQDLPVDEERATAEESAEPLLTLAAEQEDEYRLTAKPKTQPKTPRRRKR